VKSEKFATALAAIQKLFVPLRQLQRNKIDYETDIEH